MGNEEKHITISIDHTHKIQTKPPIQTSHTIEHTVPGTFEQRYTIGAGNKAFVYYFGVQELYLYGMICLYDCK